MNPIFRLFCWIGGGNRQILEELPTVRNRFFGYGTVIFMTAVFATISCAYALAFVMGKFSVLTLIPAFLWGGFIFVLDRFFVVSISNSGSFWRRFLNALPRLILAVFIGIIISKPLEYKIFEREIGSQLAKNEDLQYTEIDNLFKVRLDSLNSIKTEQEKQMPRGDIVTANQSNIDSWRNEVSEKEETRKELQEEYIKEMNGSGGSGNRGNGPIAKAIKLQIDQLVTEQENLRDKITDAEEQINNIRTEQKTQLDVINLDYQTEKKALESKRDDAKLKLKNNSKPSILNQEIALAQIKTAEEDGEKKYPGAALAITFITLLFVFIEMAPMTLKLLSKAGPYERRLAQLEATYSTEERLRRSLNLEEYKSNRKLVQKLAFSQRRIISKALDEWYDEQLRKMEEVPDEFRRMFNEEQRRQT